ncbi:MAG: hypothetical protein LBI76_10940, partial [Comamonas sp.]|nr:hypothetical protein [Comamonas sp.]
MNPNPSSEDGAPKPKLPRIPNVKLQDSTLSVARVDASQASDKTAEAVIKQMQGSMRGALSSLPEIRPREFGPARISDPTRPALTSSFAEEVRDREFAPPSFQPVKNDTGRRLMEAMEERQKRAQEERDEKRQQEKELLEYQRRSAEASEAVLAAALARAEAAEADAVVQNNARRKSERLA